MVTASLDATALVWDLAPSAAFPRLAMPPTAAELRKSWDDLALTDAESAYRAMAILDAYPEETVALATKTLSPAAPGPDAATLDGLVARLASAKFAEREKASAELTRLGESAVHGLRERLANAASAEARQRLVRALEKLDPPDSSPSRLQTKRALELLESIGTPAASGLLTKLAAGDSGARLTRDAQQSLARLKSRN